MNRPSWPTIILGFLNIIAAGFMFSLVAKAYYARAAWTYHLEVEGRVNLEGRVRYGELDVDDQTQKLIEGLSAEGQAKVQALAYKSRFAQRRAASEAAFDPIKNSGSKLRVGEEEAKKLAEDLGPRDFMKLMHNHFMLRHPELRSEEQQVAEQKATVLAMRETYRKEISQLKIEIERLDERLKAEKAVTAQMELENAERRKELSNLYAELEEAFHTRGLAEGRLKDLQEHLARTKRRFAELRKLTDQMEEQIRKTEGITGGQE